MGYITHIFYKTEDSNLVCWKEELLRKPLISNLSFAISKKRASLRWALESKVVPQAMPTSLLACINSVFQTAVTFS